MKRAFTLVEIMIVVVIIGLMAAIIIPAVDKYRRDHGPAIEATSKVVIYKAEKITVVNGYSITTYALLAKDGTGVEVKLSEFARAQVGEPWTSANWRNVD